MADGIDANLQNISPLLSERQAAKYLNISLRTVINWRERGLIPFYRIGRTIRYSREQIDRALAERHQHNAVML